MWENRAQLWNYRVSSSLFRSLEAPVNKIAVVKTDCFFDNSVSLTLENSLIENKSGSLKHILHLMVIQNESSNIPELCRDFELNSNVIEYRHSFVIREAIATFSICGEMFTEI